MRFARVHAWCAAISISIVIVVLALGTDRTAGLHAVYFRADYSPETLWVRNRSAVTTDALMADAPSIKAPFHVQWSGYLYVRRTEPRSLAIPSDGSVDVFVDGRHVFGPSSAHAGAEGTLAIERGVHTIVIWYTHFEGLPQIEFKTSGRNEPLRVVPLVDLSPVRHLPITYESAWLIRLAAFAILVLWLSLGIVWIIRPLPMLTVVIATVISGLFVAGVIFKVPAWLGGPAPYPVEWQWGTEAPRTVARWTPVVLITCGLLALIGLLPFARFPRSALARARLGLTLATIGAVGFQLSLLHFEPAGAVADLIQRVVSNDITTYFSVAATDRSSLRRFLTTYAAEMPHRDRHASSHPPGPILYYRGMIAICERAQSTTGRVFGMLERFGVHRDRLVEAIPPPEPLLAAALFGALGIVFCAGLTVWPVARIARAAGADPITAAQVGTLWAFCPSPTLFSTQFDQVVTLLVASTCAFGCVATNSRTESTRVWASLAAGGLAGLAVFCSVGALPMLVIAAAVAIVLTPSADRSWSRLFGIGALAAFAFALVSAAPILAGYDFLTTTREALAVSRYEYMLKRGYWLWVRFDLLDLAEFLGLPLFAWGLPHVVEEWRRTSPGTGQRSASLRLFWTVAILVLALDVSGVTRGEVARLWMPLMPMAFVALAPLGRLGSAAQTVDATDGGPESPSSVPAGQLFVGALLAVMCITLRLYWNPG